MFRKRKVAATVIQRHLKGEYVRIKRGKKDIIPNRVKKRQKAAIKIEALCRGELVRLKGLI